jgi:hypothetical protein
VDVRWSVLSRWGIDIDAERAFLMYLDHGRR